MNKFEFFNSNADQKLKSSLILSQFGDFNTATAILFTSFEERKKVVLLQLIDLGIPINLEIKSIKILFRNHDYRSYIGYFIDCFYEIINDLKKSN
jgi:AbiV family abortive infection protein